MKYTQIDLKHGFCLCPTVYYLGKLITHSRPWIISTLFGTLTVERRLSQ